MYNQTINPFLVTGDELATLARTKCKDTHERDRVVLIEKSGSIPAGARGRVVEVMPYHDWTNPQGLRRAVRFDEYPHDYVVTNDKLRLERLLSDKPRATNGQFLAGVKS